ncbi:hypothetical protein KC222_16650 [Cedecea davisae]|uniref:Uncharacterized protein n=1 Tax=Cedecea davisae TaxID=158484 RepID=A0ABS6DK88_9ENTR|nr:hypothetical protein [Cedecea davisae]MBU4683638.1 hypothetical protein [Cedecea davisae]MBU4685388.1 hypothetical protein [Cedecea davisae]
MASSILAVGSPENKTKAVEPSLLQANSLVRGWVFNNILGDSPAQYIKNKIDNGTLPRDTNIDMLYDRLSYSEMIKTGRVNSQKINIQELDKLYELWDCFLKDEMPFLNFKDSSALTLKLNDYNFASLYSGSRLLQRSSRKPYNYTEAITAGEKMWASAARDGITENSLKDYSAPALLYLDTNHFKKSDWHDGNILTLANMYAKYRNEASKIQEDIKLKYHKYLSTAQLWLTKGKLADNIISQCTSLRPVPEGLAFHNANQKQLLEAARTLAKQRYLDGINAPCIDAPANLEDEYQKRTSSVADAFREIDHYLIQSAINSLPTNDYKFISSKNTRLYPANIDMANYQLKTSSTAGLIKYRDLIIPLTRTKLIAARRGRNAGIERIYAFKATTTDNKGYEIFRVDRNIERYIKNGLLEYNFGSAYYINPSRPVVTANGRDFNYSLNIFTSNPIDENKQDNIPPWLIG